MEKVIKVTNTLATIGLIGGIALSSVGSASAAHVHYKDVNKADNFYNSVEYLLNEDAISKTLPNFRPYENITRGQFASIFAKVLDLDVANVENPNFKDVPTSHQFYKYVSALENKGIISGYSNGNFGINDKLTRGQMAGILVKAYGIERISDDYYSSQKNEYGPEVDILFFNDIFDGWGEKFIGGQWSDELATLESYGIMNGYKDRNMYPNKPINRSQFANMVYKMELNGIADYFYQPEEFILDGFEDNGVTEKQALIYLNEFLNAEDNELVKPVKRYFTVSYDNRGYRFVRHYQALKGINKGEYLMADGKFKFVVSGGGFQGWWLSVYKVDAPKVEEPTSPATEPTTENTATATTETE
ncbi:S-layer homology domain-containing protein [Ureibacillus sp. NPDC094379]